jgi:hypothetical protein
MCIRDSSYLDEEIENFPEEGWCKNPSKELLYYLRSHRMDYNSGFGIKGKYQVAWNPISYWLVANNSMRPIITEKKLERIFTDHKCKSVKSNAFPDNWIVRGEFPQGSEELYNSHWFRAICGPDRCISFYDDWFYNDKHSFSSWEQTALSEYTEVTKEQLIKHFKLDKHEVHKKNNESRRTGSKGSRAIRKKIQPTRASRPVGGRVTDIRCRNSIRRGSLGYNRLFSN